MVAVVGSKRHVGADHLVIRQPDRTLALLPVWMTAPTATARVTFWGAFAMALTAGIGAIFGKVV